MEILILTFIVAALGLFFAVKSRHRLIGKIAPYIAAVIIAGLIGYVDQHNDEVWAALMLIMPTAFAFGFFLPRGAWLWALIIGSGVIVAGWVALLVGHTAPCHPGIICPPASFANSLQALIALIPAMIGAYAGAILRWGAQAMRNSSI